MAKYVLIPDSFKGTLSSEDICRIASEEILRLEPEAEICAIPVADGGEGTVDAFLAAVGGTRTEVPCTGPCGQEVMGFYGLLPDGTAVVEMAAAAGLPLAGTDRIRRGHHLRRGPAAGPRRPPWGQASAAGPGRQRHQRRRLRRGRCAGRGVLRRGGRTFVPTGGTLTEIAHIRMKGLRETMAGAEVTVMCDIDNPLCGPAGAAAVFGPQKGADAAMVARMDAGLRHLAETLEKDVGMEVLTLAGGGSAGGFGAGAAAFFGGQLRMGIDVVLDLTDFDRKCRGASLVITGEGHLDSRSLRGKTVVGVARRARALGVPAAALVGGCETALDAVYAEGVSGVFPIHPALCTWPQAAARSEEDLRFTVGNLLRFMAALRR